MKTDDEKDYFPVCQKEMKDGDWVTDDPESPCLSCQQIKADAIYDAMKDP